MPYNLTTEEGVRNKKKAVATYRNNCKRKLENADKAAVIHGRAQALLRETEGRLVKVEFELASAAAHINSHEDMAATMQKRIETLQRLQVYPQAPAPIPSSNKGRAIWMYWLADGRLAWSVQPPWASLQSWGLRGLELACWSNAKKAKGRWIVLYCAKNMVKALLDACKTNSLTADLLERCRAAKDEGLLLG
jgi:hypothetical protein